MEKREEELLSEFLQYVQNSEQLARLDSKEPVLGLDNSSLNCIDQIGRLAEPNVTNIAREMLMSRGAISKIIRKLMDRGHVTAYQREDNRQKIFYCLTESGREIFALHRTRHERWEQRELAFFRQFDDRELDRVIAFMGAFNTYLQGCMEAQGPEGSEAEPEGEPG